MELSSIKDWRWIPSKQNVADDATKWAKFPKISSSDRWLNGPNFLLEPEEEWPSVQALPESTDEERVHNVFKIVNVEPIFNISRFSKWNRLLRTVAYVVRFINNCRGSNKSIGELSQEELRKAEQIIYIQSQYQKYFTEISYLKSQILLPKSSDIYNKSPYLKN